MVALAPSVKIGLLSEFRDDILDHHLAPRRGEFHPAPRSGSADKTNENSVVNVESVVGTWFVGHVKPSQEKRLSAELAAENIEHFLPLVRRRVKVRGVYQEAESVLFPQYLFFAGQVNPDGYCDARYKAITGHRLCAVLPIVNQAKFVKQIRALQIAIEENPKIGVYHKVQPGQRCTVIGGPLLGHEGFCERIDHNKKKTVVVLRVDILGQSVATEVDAEFVEVA